MKHHLADLYVGTYLFEEKKKQFCVRYSVDLNGQIRLHTRTLSPEPAVFAQFIVD